MQVIRQEYYSSRILEFTVFAVFSGVKYFFVNFVRRNPMFAVRKPKSGQSVKYVWISKRKEWEENFICLLSFKLSDNEIENGISSGVTLECNTYYIVRYSKYYNSHIPLRTTVCLCSTTRKFEICWKWKVFIYVMQHLRILVEWKMRSFCSSYLLSFFFHKTNSSFSRATSG